MQAYDCLDPMDWNDANPFNVSVIKTTKSLHYEKQTG